MNQDDKRIPVSPEAASNVMSLAYAAQVAREISTSAQAIRSEIDRFRHHADLAVKNDDGANANTTRVLRDKRTGAVAILEEFDTKPKHLTMQTVLELMLDYKAEAILGESDGMQQAYDAAAEIVAKHIAWLWAKVSSAVQDIRMVLDEHGLLYEGNIERWKEIRAEGDADELFQEYIIPGLDEIIGAVEGLKTGGDQ